MSSHAFRRAAGLLPGATIAVTLLAGCGPKPPASAPPATAGASAPTDTVMLDPTAQRQAGVSIAVARTITRADQAEAPAIVALDETRTARIGSLVEGVVVESGVQVGQRVARGQLLASLHSHAVHDAWAGYRKAIAERRRLTTELKFAEQAHARAERLLAEKAIALQDLERAAANHAAAEDELDQANTEVRRSEEELEHLGVTNGEDPTGETGEFVPVRSPVAGIVLERLVTPGTAVTPGTPLFLVSDLSTLWVLAEVDESNLSHVQTGRPVQVRVGAYPGAAFAGTLAYVGETVNPKTRRITIRCLVPNPDGRLKPEMFATVLFGETDPRAVLVIESAAVQSINGRNTVFVEESPGCFKAAAVETGAERDGLVEIRSGVSAGDRIAAGGAFVLKSELLKASMAPEG